MTDDINEDAWADDELPKSKTQVKKEMLALQELGEKLTELTPAQQARIPMGDKLSKAVTEARKITQNSARKRHFQFIGKLMRNADSDAIAQAFEAVREDQHKSIRQHHQIEQWRDRLLNDDSALSSFIEQFPDCDRQQLRQLLRASQKEIHQEGPPTNTRKLFRFVRTCFETKA